MQVKGSDNFYSNDTKKDVLVTYQIQCDADEGSLDVEIVDKDGNKSDGCCVPQGKTEDHSFSVPPGGKLHCNSGQGNCTWKGTTVATRRVERLAIWGSRVLPAAYLLAIVWLNAYICRQVFFIEFTGKMNSIHGVWIAMANLGGEHWYKPAWWPHWYNGMPFEYTYAPLVPGPLRRHRPAVWPFRRAWISNRVRGGLLSPPGRAVPDGLAVDPARGVELRRRGGLLIVVRFRAAAAGYQLQPESHKGRAPAVYLLRLGRAASPTRPRAGLPGRFVPGSRAP